MAEFDEAAVLAWLDSVPVLTAAQLAAAAKEMAEDEYDGGALANAKPKNFSAVAAWHSGGGGGAAAARRP
jgi:hypothetical protein